MSDVSLLREQLEALLAALERVPERFANVHTAAEFASSPAGMERLDSICMVLLAVGEAFKKIDRKTGGELIEPLS